MGVFFPDTSLSVFVLLCVDTTFYVILSGYIVTNFHIAKYGVQIGIGTDDISTRRRCFNNRGSSMAGK